MTSIRSTAHAHNSCYTCICCHQTIHLFLGNNSMGCNALVYVLILQNKRQRMICSINSFLHHNIIYDHWSNYHKPKALRRFLFYMISKQISVKDLICLSFLYPPASKLLYFPYKEYHSSVSSQETTTINTFFIEKCGSVGSSSQHREMMIWKHFVPRNVLSQ
jgi:hypothetical protein